MSSKRQHGKLQNIHTRIPIKDYQTIQLICNQLKISQAEYFNSCIHQFGYERLLLYARKINREPRPCRVDISEPASEEICHLTKAMNAQAEQIRKCAGLQRSVTEDAGRDEICFGYGACGRA